MFLEAIFLLFFISRIINQLIFQKKQSFIKDPKNTTVVVLVTVRKFKLLKII